MRRKSLLLPAAIVVSVVVVTAGPKLLLSWKNPNYTGGKFKNILVLALDGKAANRAEFEDQLSAAISRPGSQVSPSYEFIVRPNATPIDMNDMRALVREQKID